MLLNKGVKFPRKRYASVYIILKFVYGAYTLL